MPTYIALSKYTQKGIESISQSAERHAAQQAEFQRIGVRTKDLYLTMGRYDIVNIMEAPDDATMARMALTIGSWGFLRTETLRAFSLEEYREIIGSLGASG